MVAVFICQIHLPSSLVRCSLIVRSTLLKDKISSSLPQGCLRGGANRPDKQLAVEPEEQFTNKNAITAVVHIQDWASLKKKLSLTVKTPLYNDELSCGNVITKSMKATVEKVPYE